MSQRLCEAKISLMPTPDIGDIWCLTQNGAAGNSQTPPLHQSHNPAAKSCQDQLSRDSSGVQSKAVNKQEMPGEGAHRRELVQEHGGGLTCPPTIPCLSARQWPAGTSLSSRWDFPVTGGETQILVFKDVWL